jgi:ribosomal-protein-alanine N-acetyltransferase
MLRTNQEFLAPWDPIRGDAYYTVDGQRDVVRAALKEHGEGRCLPHVILDDSGVVGRITLNGIVRGAFQSCSVGYWVSAAHTGRGLATSALRHILRAAFDDLGLHRVQAEILAHNTASQRVLERNGFIRFGVAPKYLNIGGQWQDHILYQVINDTTS